MRSPIKFAEYVELAIPASVQQRNYFPDLPNLRGKQILGIEAYSASEQGVSESGATVQAASDFPSALLVLFFGGGEYIKVPLVSIRRVNNTTNGWYFQIPELGSLNIDWTKSYVFITANTANFASKSFLFNVYYTQNN